MRQSAAVLCRDNASLRTLQPALEELGIDPALCSSNQEALELVLSGHCSTLIVDFDLGGAEDVVRMAALLPPAQKPALLAVASRVWPGTGQAFQSGVSRILYRPLDSELVKDAVKAGRKAPNGRRRKSTRYEMKSLVYLEVESTTLAAVTIDISEHGLALQASDPVPISTQLPFRCMLPGTDFTLKGHADVIWASDQGRAGLFFSKLAPAAQKHLKNWLHKRNHARREGKFHDRKNDGDSVRYLLPPEEGHVRFP